MVWGVLLHSWKIAHMKMGVIGVGLLEPIVACAIFGESAGVQINA